MFKHIIDEKITENSARKDEESSEGKETPGTKNTKPIQSKVITKTSSSQTDQSVSQSDRPAVSQTETDNQVTTPSTEDQPKRKAELPTRRCKFFNSTKGCSKDKCTFLHDSNPNNPQNLNIFDNTIDSQKKKRECRFYKTERGCLKGTECPFPHGEPAQRDNNITGSKQTGELEDGQSRKASETIQKKCRFYNTQRGCIKGEKCSFEHIEEEQDKADEKKDNGNSEECRFFNSKRGCWKGARCPYRHESNNSREPKQKRTGDGDVLERHEEEEGHAKNVWQGMQKQMHSLNTTAAQMMETMSKLNIRMAGMEAKRKD